MRAALAIAAAELRAHRAALLAAVPYGLLSHLVITSVPRLGFPKQMSPTEAAHLGFYAITICQLCMAAYLGAAAVSRDLSERRLGFYLARPVAPLAYWGPKLAVAFLVAYLFGWLMWLPGLLIGPPPGWLVLDAIARELPVAAAAFAIAFVVAAASTAAGALRARSGLLLADVVMLGVTAAAFLAVLARSWDQGTTDVVHFHARPWLWGTAFVLVLGAGAAQVSVGRLDLRRGHVLLSTTLWLGLLACVGGLALLSSTVAGATPSDLSLSTSTWIQAPPAGNHVLLDGPDGRWRDRREAFFLDGQGRFVRKGATWLTGSAWSDDGRRFAWSHPAFPLLDEPVWRSKPLQSLPGVGPSLWVMDFDQPGAAPRLIARRAPAIERVSALSPSGRRVLISNLTGRSKLVVAADDGRTLATIGEPASWSEARFLSETTVRALRMDGRQGRIVEWDTESGRLLERGAIAFDGASDPLPRRLIPTHDWGRVLRLDSTGLFLHDLDGKLLATLVDGWLGRRSRAAGLLSQGRFGSVDLGPQGPRLRVFDRDGRQQLETLVEGLAVGGESAPGVLVLARPGESAFVDLATGNIVRREHGLVPALRAWTPWAGSASVEPGSLATRLFLSEQGLVRLDPAGGGRKLIVQRRPS